VLFNLFLGNHRAGGLKGMADLILPIFHGLADLGHEVIGYGLNMRPAPAVNLLFEFFPDDAFVDELLRMKAEQGEKFIFGVVCTEDVEDSLVMEQPEFPRRRANLMRILPAADFVWTLLPQVATYDAIAGSPKTALIEYGFSERFLSPRLIPDVERRDVDVLMYGNATPYRMPVVEELRRRGFACFVTDRQAFPDFAATDLVSRSKIVLDLRRGPGVRFPSPTRICKALHAGALVVAEHLGDSAIASLYGYTVACAYDELVERCTQVIRSGLAAQLGLAALAKYRAEATMAACLARAMAVPVLARRVAGTGSTAP
jgi:hypothetical protein